MSSKRDMFWAGVHTGIGIGVIVGVIITAALIATVGA
jgi:hypothetical protein